MNRRTNTCRTVGLAFVCYFATPANLFSQEGATAEPAFCFRGKPAPTCRWFALTESSVDARVGKGSFSLTPVDENDGAQPTGNWRPASLAPSATVGVMRNVGSHHAVGAGLTLLPGWDGPRYGVKARYRRWIGANGMAFDATAGILEGSPRLTPNRRPPFGFSSDVALDYKGFVAVTTRVDLLRGNGSPKPLLHVGVRAGAGPAFALAAAIANVFAVGYSIRHLD